MAITEKYCSATGRGNQDGNSPANAARFTGAWFEATANAQHLHAANLSSTGLNTPVTWRPARLAQDPDRPEYITPQRGEVPGVAWCRMNFLTDDGPYTVDLESNSADHPLRKMFTANNDDCGVLIGEDGAGTHRALIRCAYEASSGKRPEDEPGSMVTKTQTELGIASQAAADNPANYDSSGNYIGALAEITLTVTRQAPSRIRAVFQGGRTKDPRVSAANRSVGANGMNRADWIWCVGNDRRPMDPLSAGAESRLKNPDGSDMVLNAGDCVNYRTGERKAFPFTNSGGFIGRETGNAVIWDGFECRDGGFLAHSYGVDGRLQAYRNIVVDNAKTVDWRGDGQRDVEWSYFDFVAVSQKALGGGKENTYWSVHHGRYDGAYVTGDPIQALQAVTEDYAPNGPHEFRFMHVDRAWGDYKAGASYGNGDVWDYEGESIAVRDALGVKFADGFLDNKAASVALGVPNVFCARVIMEDAKRCVRVWEWKHSNPAYAGREGIGGLYVFHDVVLKNARQHGVFFAPGVNTRRRLFWTNPSRLPHVSGTRAFTVFSAMDGPVDAVVVARRFCDSRGANKGSISQGTGLTVLRPTAAAPPAVTQTVDDVAYTGARLQKQVGDVFRAKVLGLPAGASGSWSSDRSPLSNTTGDTTDVTMAL